MESRYPNKLLSCVIYTLDDKYQLLNLYAHYLVSKVQTLVYVGEDIVEDSALDVGEAIGEAIGLDNSEGIAFEIAFDIHKKAMHIYS